MYPNIHEIIHGRQWSTFCKHPQAASMRIVREFYANAKEHTNRSTFVQGKFVPFNTDAIDPYFDIPKAVIDEYNEYIIMEPNFNKVINYFFKSNKQWKMSKRLPLSFKNSQLYGAYKCCLYFIATRLLLMKHVTNITKDIALLLYYILTGKAINIGKLIYITILFFANTPHEDIWFPSLITDL
ncbi:Uncharacterized protein TCM_013457 [Theobroma cacao]|uniref:Putative plant transposon protein domain-containing protein n=1 Tax=Theobroma cacao TaxID=3641 RepID=A0A061FWE6_THECC|nr:Uncharacterized protein TCM_013457 [Theobroma cacao]